MGIQMNQTFRFWTLRVGWGGGGSWFFLNSHCNAHSITEISVCVVYSGNIVWYDNFWIKDQKETIDLKSCNELITSTCLCNGGSIHSLNQKMPELDSKTYFLLLTLEQNGSPCTKVNYGHKRCTSHMRCTDAPYASRTRVTPCLKFCCSCLACECLFFYSKWFITSPNKLVILWVAGTFLYF